MSENEEDWEQVLKRRKREEERLLRRLNELLPYMHTPEGEKPLTREEKLKLLTKEINKALEEKSWEGICRTCKSSVCRCPKEEEQT